MTSSSGPSAEAGGPAPADPTGADSVGGVPARLGVELVALLRNSGRTVAVAESLTGGLVVAALVAVPGASSCLRGGVVAYASELKSELLRVPAELLAREGAVHLEVARAMAHGARDLMGADYGIATTGVAGPDPQDGVSPGAYHVAVAGPSADEVRDLVAGSVGRDQVRQEATAAALELALDRIRADEMGTGSG